MPPVRAITDEDIAWVSDLMSLENIVDGRREFLRSLSSVDVTACPGSGKTTLLVAKLGILGKNWNTPTAGICVLSHTNVAKDEISDRLGGTEVGAALLRYPNYIDTIHGFTNRFLTTPFLLSAGHRATTIDDEATGIMRRQALPAGDASTLESWLNRTQRSMADLRISSLDLDNPLSGQDFGAGPSSRMHQLATKALSTAARAGFFCHDEILTLGYLFAKSAPSVARALSTRFPVVLVDEMQDTSQEQNQVMQEVFQGGGGTSIVQRVGDLNQAIYGSTEGQVGLGFPASDVQTLSLDNSYRFDESIAKLVNGLAVSRVLPDGLRGVARPQRKIHHGAHKIFVFPDDDPTGVLDAFGKHVVSVLPTERIAGAKVCAVGGVSRSHPEIGPGHRHFPKSVSHYWGDYQANATKKSYRPRRLTEYFILAGAELTRSAASHQAVNVIANGLSRLANIMSSQQVIGTNRRQHLYLTQLLGSHPDELHQYQAVVAFVLSGGTFDDQETWNSWIPTFLAVSGVLGTDPASHLAESFLTWQPHELNSVAGKLLPGTEGGVNTYRYRDEDKSSILDIQLGSVHSVKGETHTATLLLETFYYEHHLAHLVPWLIRQGKYSTPSPIPDRTATFMRWAYVALSRPTHVACLAVPARSFNSATDIEQLTSAGWAVERI
jgi:hypothetical protein